MGKLETLRSDPRHARVVWAPSPVNQKDAVKLEVDPELILHLLVSKRFAAFAEYQGLVHGQLVQESTAGLMAAKALSRGLRRPMREFEVDELARLIHEGGCEVGVFGDGAG